MNASKSAELAGFSARSAYSTGERLMRNAEISTAINERLKKTSDDKGDLRERLLTMLEEVAMVKLSDFGRIGPSGIEIFDQEKIDERKLIAIQEFNVHESNSGVNVRIKLSDRLKAAELLMKHMGMLKDKLEVSLAPPVGVIECIDGRRVEVGVLEGEIVK